MDGLVTNLVADVEMRMHLSDLQGLRPSQVHSVFKSMKLVASDLLDDRRRLREQYFKYGQRVLEFDTFFRCPSLAPCGASHGLSKFHDMVAEGMPGIVCGRVKPNLRDVLEGTVLDWLGTAVSKVAERMPLDRGAKELSWGQARMLRNLGTRNYRLLEITD